MKQYFVLLFLFTMSPNNKSEVVIYADSYLSIKESYEDNIENFIVFDSELSVKIENEDIINEFKNTVDRIDEKYTFIPGETKTVIIINSPEKKDTILIKWSDSKKKSYKELIKLTNQFLIEDYKIR